MLLYSLLQSNDTYRIINELMNRFSLFQRDPVCYDSIVVLSKNKVSKQFATNLSIFNSTFRNVFLLLVLHSRYLISWQIQKQSILSTVTRYTQLIYNLLLLQFAPARFQILLPR